MSLETQAPPTATNHDFDGDPEVAATATSAGVPNNSGGGNGTAAGGVGVVNPAGGGGSAAAAASATAAGGGGGGGESTINNNRGEQTPRTPLKMSSENNADAMNAMMGAPPRASVATSIGLNGTHNLSQSNLANNNASNWNQNLKSTESDDDDFSGGGVGSGVGGGGFGGIHGGAGGGGGHNTTYGGHWGALRATSRAVSPTMMDNMSENSSQPPMTTAPLNRSKSRTDLTGPSSRYGNLSYWKARRVLFYRNGDPFFPGVEFRFKPFRDIVSLEALLDKISPKMDLPRGARYVFSMDGDRKYNLDELEDGASYVVSSFKGFKVSTDFHYLNCFYT